MRCKSIFPFGEKIFFSICLLTSSIIFTLFSLVFDLTGNVAFQVSLSRPCYLHQSYIFPSCFNVSSASFLVLPRFTNLPFSSLCKSVFRVIMTQNCSKGMGIVHNSSKTHPCFCSMKIVLFIMVILQ